MLTLISTIIAIVGLANWFTIGALQYDFVAGLFGSQANIFSRIIYVLVGIAGMFLAYSIIKNKGRLVFKNKSDMSLFNFNKKKALSTEASTDNSYDAQNNENRENLNENIEASHDNSISTDEKIQSRANRINDKNRLSTKNYTEASYDNHRQNNNNSKN